MAIIDNTIKSIKKKFPCLGSAKRKIAIMISPRDPVYVFHHIPKCGGTSVREVLHSWFIIFYDYRRRGTLDYPEKVDLNSWRSAHCLCGHFEMDGYYLHQRYPEVFISNRFKVFTFVRDPLQVQLSLFRYEKKYGVNKTEHIEEHLFLRPNYIAHRLLATMDNYREVIDRYFFVGILENGQASLDLLADIIGKPRKSLPWKNRTQNTLESRSSTNNLSEELVERFRSDSALDYLIYNYCVEKLQKMLAEHDAL